MIVNLIVGNKVDGLLASELELNTCCSKSLKLDLYHCVVSLSAPPPLFVLHFDVELHY